MKYDQKQDKGSFFINMTTVLLPSGRVRVQTETFSRSTGRSLSPSTVPKRTKWQDRRIIPVNIDSLFCREVHGRLRNQGKGHGLACCC